MSSSTAKKTIYTTNNHPMLSLLQLIIILASVVFFFFGIDLYKRRKATFLHFLVFIGGGAGLAVITFFPDALNTVGGFFGIARGADLIVYVSIITLMFFYIEMLNKTTKQKYTLTTLTSRLALAHASVSIQEAINKYHNIQSRLQGPKAHYCIYMRVYNEATTVGSVIDNVINAGFRKIVCVNDGSTDDSADIIRQKQQEYPEAIILCLSHTVNRGPGAPHKTGFAFFRKYARTFHIQRVVMLDADRQMDIADIDTFMERIEYNLEQKNTSDVYFGSRFLDKAATNMSRIKKILLRIHSGVSKLLYGIYVRDAHCGFRVLSIDAIQKIHIETDGRHYANELVDQVHKHNFSYEEVPVHIKYTEYSKNKPTAQKPINSIKIGLEMIYKKFFFR